MARYYLDHNASSPLRPAVRDEYVRRLDQLAGNPSSVHASGRAARAVLDEARLRVAAALGVQEDEIVFTAGGTEAIHLALHGLRPETPGRTAVVFSAIEHSAVLRAAAALEADACRPCAAEVDASGRLDLDALVSQIASVGAGLVAVQLANNEVGVVHPIAELSARLGPAGRPGPAGRERPRLFTDAVQALGRIPLRLAEWGIDAAAFSAHKVGGPLGVGLLYKRKGSELRPRWLAGEQEGGLRGGTENVPAIAAAALAIELAVREEPERGRAWRRQSADMWRQLQAKVPELRLNGPAIDAPDRLPNTLNLSLPGRDGRMLVARLDLEGVELSAGSACASGSLEASHVLTAMGRSDSEARAGLRVSFGWNTSDEDVHRAVEIMGRILGNSR